MTVKGFEEYLARLGVRPAGRPSVEELFALQRAHLARIPYENVGIQLGRPPGMAPEESVRRFAAGEGGYCFHLNGALAALLGALGYDVSLHAGGVHTDADGRGATGNHLALTVRVGGAAWFVDVGLGDGPFEPLPLREGTYALGDFVYRLRRSEAEPGGWSLYPPHSSDIRLMEFRTEPAALADFAAEHVRLSTAADSGFVKTFAMLRRDEKRVWVLRGRVLTRIEAAGAVTEEIDTPEEWFGTMEERFLRRVDGLDADDRAALWLRVSRAHGEWLARRGRDGSGGPVAAGCPDAAAVRGGETGGQGGNRREDDDPCP
ncbi:MULTISPECIES: arylamine N-acetyltransferase family protein [unclassified Streptomyces]|uniref:arylamine N-acetyltransferase family protein n=1 Tax=unclassified Streptomyces TaxID=2593676 RepID=UPI0009A10F25|nr:MULTISPECIES: arylamine N-acetyltransferase [unclassified Streptomyces]